MSTETEGFSLQAFTEKRGEKKLSRDESSSEVPEICPPMKQMVPFKTLTSLHLLSTNGRIAVNLPLPVSVEMGDPVF